MMIQSFNLKTIQLSNLKQFNCSIEKKNTRIYIKDTKHDKSHQIKMGIVTCTRQCDGKKLVILIC